MREVIGEWSGVIGELVEIDRECVAACFLSCEGRSRLVVANLAASEFDMTCSKREIRTGHNPPVPEYYQIQKHCCTSLINPASLEQRYSSVKQSIIKRKSKDLL
jgi:hypothetical protein